MDDLREKELINGLKLSTEDFQPVTAYQVSKKGLDFLKQVPPDMKQSVDAFLHSPQVSFQRNPFLTLSEIFMAYDLPSFPDRFFTSIFFHLLPSFSIFFHLLPSSSFFVLHRFARAGQPTANQVSCGRDQSGADRCSRGSDRRGRRR